MFTAVMTGSVTAIREIFSETGETDVVLTLRLDGGADEAGKGIMVNCLFVGLKYDYHAGKLYIGGRIRVEANGLHLVSEGLGLDITLDVAYLVSDVSRL